MKRDQKIIDKQNIIWKYWNLIINSLCHVLSPQSLDHRLCSGKLLWYDNLWRKNSNKKVNHFFGSWFKTDMIIWIYITSRVGGKFETFYLHIRIFACFWAVAMEQIVYWSGSLALQNVNTLVGYAFLYFFYLQCLLFTFPSSKTTKRKSISGWWVNVSSFFRNLPLEKLFTL